jgi:hypothetical protein
MPCYSGGSNESNVVVRTEYIRGDEKTIQSQSEKIKYLEACLCAIINELETQKLTTQVIPAASEHGGIDLMKFWNRHKEEDETRILIKLREFSKHEIEIAKRMMAAYNL